MNILFNVAPLISYTPSEEHQEALGNGYAATLKTIDNAQVMYFQDVDDHIDGNGLAILWLIQGEGTFYIQDTACELKQGDTILFDDRLEHGFASNEPCVAVNFTVQPDITPHEIKAMVHNFNHPFKKIKP